MLLPDLLQKRILFQLTSHGVRNIAVNTMHFVGSL
jgi:hypothetical protein